MARARNKFLHNSFIWLVILVGILMAANLFLHQPVSIDMWRELAVLTIFGVLAEIFVVPVPQGSLSLGFAIVVFTFIRFDLTSTVLVSCLSAFIGQGITAKGISPRSFLFNGAQYSISAIIAAYSYFAVGGQALNKISLFNTLPLLVFIAVYFVVNHVLVSMFILPSVRAQVLGGWKTSMKWDLLTYVIASPIGFLMALIHEKTGLLGAVLLFIPLLTLKYLLSLYINLETANKALSALYEVAKNLGSSLDMPSTLGLILSETQKVVNYDTGIIYLWEEEDKILIPTAIKSKYADKLKGINYNLGEGVIGAVAETKEPKIIYDSKQDKELRNIQGMNQFLRSMLVIPLNMDNKLIGVIAVGKKNPSAFTLKHLNILESLGGQAAVAMANSILYKKIEKLAITDGLTGVYNHRYFYRRLDEEAERAKRYGSYFSLIMLDIDFFKKFNDQYGHRAGDNALQFVSRAITENTRSIDIVCRYGGEEFVVILPETDYEKGAYVAERIRDYLQQRVFPISEEMPPVSITVSAGTATFNRDSDDIFELIEMADKALYYSKKSGRNRVSNWCQLPVRDI